MDVIRIDPDLLKFDGISLFDFFTDSVERLLAVKIAEDALSVLHWSHEMIVNLIGVVLGRLDRSHTLHTISYKVTDAAELRGIIKLKTHFFCSMECKNAFHAKAMHGDGNANWHGGISFHPYAPSFNKRLKKQIVERDNGRCRLCGKKAEENFCGTGRGLVIHHINYDKQNSLPENLIALCNRCHGRTHYNRVIWQARLSKILKS